MSEYDEDARDPVAIPKHRPATSAMSRRTLVKTAAGAGVAVAAISVTGAAFASGDSKTAPDESSTGGPVVVYLTDAHAGSLEIFTEGVRSEVTDVDLARRISHAASTQR